MMTVVMITGAIVIVAMMVHTQQDSDSCDEKLWSTLSVLSSAHTSKVELWSWMAALRLQSWTSSWSWGRPTKAKLESNLKFSSYFQMMIDLSY